MLKTQRLQCLIAHLLSYATPTRSSRLRFGFPPLAVSICSHLSQRFPTRCPRVSLSTPPSEALLLPRFHASVGKGLCYNDRSNDGFLCQYTIISRRWGSNRRLNFLQGSCPPLLDELFPRQQMRTSKI